MGTASNREPFIAAALMISFDQHHDACKCRDRPDPAAYPHCSTKYLFVRWIAKVPLVGSEQIAYANPCQAGNESKDATAQFVGIGWRHITLS